MNHDAIAGVVEVFGVEWLRMDYLPFEAVPNKPSNVG